VAGRGFGVRKNGLNCQLFEAGDYETALDTKPVVCHPLAYTQEDPSMVGPVAAFYFSRERGRVTEV
jgi:hypothetical protein